MTLSEKLYMLRKKRGLSQEQLAEQLNVSRQAISKWESGQSTPETEKLLATAKFFQVSLDYLLSEDTTQDTDPVRQETTTQTSGGSISIAGSVICISGLVLLILWGLMSVLNPQVSEQIGGSSLIQIDGNGMILILCVAAIICGAWMLLKGPRK